MGVARGKEGQRTRFTIAWVGLGALLLLVSVFSIGKTEAKDAATGAITQTIQRLTLVGTSTIHSTPLGTGAYALPETPTQDAGTPGLKGLSAAHPLGLLASPRHVNLPIPSKEAARLRFGAALANSLNSKTTLPLPEPIVEPSTVVSFQSGGFQGFSGLTHIDQRTANGGNQYSLEPPDQGLCAGNGYVVETVNDVIRVFDTQGNALTGVEDLNTFLGLATQLDRAHGNVPGPFVSDPKCYFDHQTQRWFVSVLMQDNGNNTGATGRFFNMLAVSQTSHPTGAWTIFQYDVTDDGLNGTPNHAGCPCFGDQPLLGADRYGVYQTTNEFGAAVFNGAQVYAISKAGLVAAADSASPTLPPVVAIDASQALLPFGGLSYSIQPATSPAPGFTAFFGNGIEYFLSALQFGNPGYEVYDNRIAVWAMTNTRSLNSNTPNPHLQFAVIHSETYGQPDPAAQKAGPTPLGTLLGEPLELVATNDDRMNQTVFANGILYGAVNSKLSVGGGDQTGAAWFAVLPFFQGPNLRGQVIQQGYVAVTGDNVIFPSVGVNAQNQGVIAYSLVGPDYFPTAAYTRLNFLQASSLVHIAGAGQGPEDGFSGYVAFGNNGVARWGDYSAATWDGERVWFANEYIPKSCPANALPCRTSLANWGTFFSSIEP